MFETGFSGPPPADLGGLDGGVVRAVVLYPDPRLRARCDAAGYLGADGLCDLVRDLLATMYAVGARGLAAPQIGVPRRVFVMDAGWLSGTPAPVVMLDPEIVARSEDGAEQVERCLSVPDTPVCVRRALSIDVGWYDLDGVHHRAILSGAEARVVQHEADHLDGRLIVDGLS